jgi:ABC-type sulfate/molybdate transport systems ATPase subunit
VGKSTLLHAICGLVRVSNGSVFVNETDITAIPAHKRGIGLVSQTGDLFPNMTVSQNIEFGLRIKHMTKADRTARVQELLEMINLSPLAHRSVMQLSGGEVRRIALARALAPEPRILLLDEPFSGLDESTHELLSKEVFQLLADLSITSIIVTHEIDDTRRCDEVVTLKK